MKKSPNKNKVIAYIISTIGYGIMMVLGILASIFFLLKQRYFMVFLSILFFYVAFDNFFCSSRAKKCGFPAVGHYMVPPFLRK